MPEPYSGKLANGINEFDYGGKHYTAGDNFGPFDSCEAAGFINAASQSNPNTGFNEEHQGIIDEIARDCPATPNTSTPQPAPASAPVETNPTPAGGDSAGQQAAPTPPVTGTTDGTQASGGDAPTEEPVRPPAGEPHPTHGGEQSQSQTNAGDPVDIFTGSFYLQEADLVVPNTILPLSFVRVYRSGAATYGPFGWNWDHNYNMYLRELSNGDIALWRMLHEDIFVFDGVNFEPPRGTFEKLERVPGVAQAFVITCDGGVVMRFERPAGWIDGERIPIVEIQDRHGNKQIFSYTPDDKVSEVRDDDNRFLQFGYDQCGLLVTVSDHAGRSYQYEHDEQTMQLTCVQTPPTADFPSGVRKLFHYEQPFAPPELRHNIVRVEDSEGNVYVENTYEQDPSAWHYARVIEQLYGGFLYQFRYTQLQWVPANSVYVNLPAVRVEVMNPDFGLATYTFNYRGDLLDRRYRLNKDKSFRVVVWQYEFDAQGNLTITTHPDGGQEINTYDFGNPDPRMRGKLLRRELTSAAGFPAPSRIIWNARYEPVYQLISEQSDELGSVTRYRYDFDITPGAMTNSGRLVEVRHPDTTLPDGTVQSSITTYESNTQGQITATILANGVRHERIYGAAGNEKSRLVRKIFDVGGLDIVNEVRYDAYGFETEFIDGNGNSTKTIRNALGLQENTVLPPIGGASAEHHLHYDADKRMIAAERPRGAYADAALVGNYITDRYERDVLGYITAYVLSANTSESRTIHICSDFRGLPVKTANPDGSSIQRTYDERGLLIAERVVGNDGLELTSKKVYDRAGKLIQETDSFGRTTRYEYDGFSRIRKITRLNQTEINYTWLRGDRLGSEEVIGDDGFGNRRVLSSKVFTYDEKGRQISETRKSFRTNPAAAVDVTTTRFFDEMDRVEKTVTNRGGTIIYQYDGMDRLILETDAIGNEYHNRYDNNGNLLQTDRHDIEPDNSVSIISKQYAYDARNRKTETIEPDGAISAQTYDDRDLIIQQTDYAGIIRQITYNSFQNRTSETYDAGGLNVTHQWAFDNMSRITAYIDPTGQASTYHLDSLGRVYQTDYPNGSSTTKTFNDMGQVIEEILGSGVRFEYDYDSAGRVVKIRNTAAPGIVIPVGTHELVYDGYDRVVTANVGTDRVVREYDSLGRLLREETNGSSITAAYDDTIGLVEKTWPDGRTERYSHNLNDVTTDIEETANGALGTGAGLITSLKPSGKNYFGEASYQGGLTVVNRYDARKRLTEIAVSSPAPVNERIAYRYNTNDKRQIEAFFGQQPKLSYFEFDNKYRLVTARDGFAAAVPNATTQPDHDAAINVVRLASAGAAHEEQFDYDLADARTRYTETANPVKNYAYLAGHRIQNDSMNNYTYYADGTLQDDGILTYEADAMGRIVTVNSGATPVCQIVYDAFGRPTRIQETGKPEKSFNYFGGFVEQENENGNPSRQITTHPVTGVPIAYHTTNATYYTLFDSRYSLFGVTDTNGNLLESFRYKAFGAPQIFDAAGNILTASALGIEPFFGGQRYLSSAGLYLSKRRVMNPVNGVFLSVDPNGYVDSASLYVYAAQDPINNIDPNGEIIPFIIAAFVIGGALAGAGYSFYDAYHHPERYEGAAGFWRPLANTFGGAAVGAVAVLAGEAVLGLGGTGIFAAGSGGAATTLTASQTFVLYGTSTATTGYFLRSGFNSMFPEYVNPASPTTMMTDFVAGGGLGVVARGIGLLASRASSNATYTLQGNREAILESQRIWGQTEGSVYGLDTPNLPSWRGTGGGTVGSDSAIFRFSGENNVFQPHEVTGPFSLIKRLLGQSKAGFGDLAFEEAAQIGTRLVKGNEIPIYELTGVRLLPNEFAGQSATWAASRLWGRRILDVALASGLLAAAGLNIYDWDSGSESRETRHPNEPVTEKK